MTDADHASTSAVRAHEQEHRFVETSALFDDGPNMRSCGNWILSTTVELPAPRRSRCDARSDNVWGLKRAAGGRTTRSRGAGRHQLCGLGRRVGLLGEVEVFEAGVAAVP